MHRATLLDLYYSDNVDYKADLWGRRSLPLSLITLTLVAIPLSCSMPRQIFYSRLLFAALDSRWLRRVKRRW